MKILILTTSYPLSAGQMAGHFVRQAALEIAKGGHEITVIAPDHAAAQPIDDGPNLLVRRCRYWPSRRGQILAYGAGIIPNLQSHPSAILQTPLLFFAMFFAAFRLAREADVIHAYWGFCGAIALLLKYLTRKPVVLSILGSDLSGAGGKFITRLTKFVAAHVDHVTAASAALAQNLVGAQRAVPLHNQVKVIYNGVTAIQKDICLDITTPPPSGGPPLLGKEAVGARHAVLKIAESFLPNQQFPAEPQNRHPVFLFVGRLVPVKGPDIAVRAFIQAAQGIPDIELLIIGEGPMKKELEDYCLGQTAKIKFCGEVPYADMPQYYKEADALIISSRFEGLPNCLLEAMACGLAVISFDVGGVAEVLTPERGILVPNGDEAGLAQQIKLLAKDRELAGNLGAAASSWARENISWAKVAEEYLAVYQECFGYR